MSTSTAQPTPPAVAGATGAAEPLPAGGDVSPTPPIDTDDTDDRAGVELTALGPVVSTSADVLSISGTILNRSDETLGAVNAYLRMSRVPTTERDEIDLLDDPSFRPGFRPGPFVPVVDTLDPGASVPFRLDIPVPELGLTGPGVYPVGIEVLAGLEDGGRDVVGAARTVLPWLPPDTEAATTGVAIALPLSAAIDRLPDGTYLSENLGALLAPGGGLATALAVPTGPAISWLVDPALLEAAADLADGYRVRTDAADAASAVPGAHAADAADWLAALSERLSSQSAWSASLLPYGNPDLVALVRAGMAADVAAAVEAAPEVVERLDLGAPFGDSTPSPMVYPPAGLVDAATLQVLAAAGVRDILLADTALAADAPAPRVASVDAGGVAVRAATTDAALSDILAANAGPVHTRQLLLAHTALAALAAESPADQTLTVVVPPVPLSAAAAEAMAVLTGDAPWLTSVPLAAAFGQPEEAATVRYPDGAIAAELDPAYLGGVAALQGRTGVLAELTGDIDAAEERALGRLRAESAAWRADPGRASTLLAARAAALDATLGLVRIVTTGTVTLSSDSGRFPLTIANDLDVPVSVGLALTPTRPARLQTSTPGLIQVAPGAKTTVDVSARAAANGTYLVDARLQTAGGEPFGASTTITLRATAYDTVAWIVMGAAGGLLIVGSGLRIARRLRA